MARKKVRLAYITNNSSRKITFKKRKKGMMKKISELTTLCGIDACAVVYNPFDSQPEVWPSPSGVKDVLDKFKTLSVFDKTQKMLNQETYLKLTISKTNEQLKKIRRENHEKDLRRVMLDSLTKGTPQLHSLNLADIGDLEQLINHILYEIDSRKKKIGEEAMEDENHIAGVGPVMHAQPVKSSCQPRRQECEHGESGLNHNRR